MQILLSDTTIEQKDSVSPMYLLALLSNANISNNQTPQNPQMESIYTLLLSRYSLPK